MARNVYFAAKPPEEAAAILISKANSWYNQLYSNGYLDKVKEMWMAHHGAYNSSVAGGHNITFSGEQGELVQMNVNHMRNIANHIITMITSNRPSFQAQAVNTDSKSATQTTLANDLLDYYLRDKRLEKYLRTAVEYAVVLGSGFIKMSWNATTGEIYEFNEDTNTPIYEGDVEFANLSPYDVVFDTTKDSSMSHDWVLCRTFKNKFDIAAKYPELADRITGLQTKSDTQRYRLEMLAHEETEDIPVYEFYHRKTEALPEGRYILFLAGDIVLMDSPMPYRSLPVYRIAPGDILGTPYGYTPMFDLLPIQKAINALYSTILTNQHTFGVQNIYIPRGADVQMKALEGGLNIIEGNSGAGKPEPMNFTSTPAEIFKFVEMLEQKMEIISAVNSVARGNPEASLKSGAALALVQSMALQFISGLQQQYVQLIEDIGTDLVIMLRDFAAVPRISVIGGLSNQNLIREEFTGDDLELVNRVKVDVGNSISKTTAGKMQIASELIQYNIIKTPEDYFSVLNTGQLNSMVEDPQRELNYLKKENEMMLKGSQPTALATDPHVMHIKKHKAMLADPTLRNEPGAREIIMAHILEHVELLRSTDPALLVILGEQPLGPVNGSPPSDVGTDVNNSMQPDPSALNLEAPADPNIPSIPQVPAEVLPNPELQAQSLGNVDG